MSCRTGEQWSAPVFMQLAKGSWGFQAGAEQVDVVLLVMNESGVQKLLKNKVNLGADASMAAGPMGAAAASTDAVMKAEILSYSRAKGLFAGIDLSGGVLRPDEDANKTSTARARRQRRSSRRARCRRRRKPPASCRRSRVPRRPRGSRSPWSPRRRLARRSATADDDVRARVVDLQQSLDRMLAETTPAAVGTGGTVGANDTARGTVTVDRGRLMQIRQQLDGLLASLNRR